MAAYFEVFMKVKALKLFYTPNLGTIALGTEFNCEEKEAKKLINDGYLESLELEIKPKKEEKLETKPAPKAKKSTKKAK